MKRKELLDAAKELYQKGYREGFEDACDIIAGNMTSLKVSMAETLEKHTIVVDETAFDVQTD